MPITRIITDLEEARRTVLKRRPLGSEEVPASVAARIREVFGADLTPGEVVDRILADVQAEGDTALARYSAAFRWRCAGAIGGAAGGDRRRTAPSRRLALGSAAASGSANRRLP